MGWFSKKPDPVGDICRLLVERPFEWHVFSPGRKRTGGELYTTYRHVTGVIVGIPLSRRTDVLLMQRGGDGAMTVGDYDGGNRLRAAVLARLSAIAKSRRIDVPETGKLLARAVLDGHGDGIWPLVDYLLENVERPKEGG